MREHEGGRASSLGRRANSKLSSHKEVSATRRINSLLSETSKKDFYGLLSNGFTSTFVRNMNFQKIGWEPDHISIYNRHIV